MTSRDLQWCCEAVRSGILATAWLLVLKCMSPSFSVVQRDLLSFPFCFLSHVRMRSYADQFAEGELIPSNVILLTPPDSRCSLM